MNCRVLVSDPLAEEGVEILREVCDVDIRTGCTEDELVEIIGDYDALLVRSGTRVTERVIEAAHRLTFIGRAGAGVDNIDLDAATRRGIIVANAPEGNTLAATEHTMAMILSMARKIPQANISLRGGEWQRSAFMGVELNEKVLGIVGFGRIGREVAKRANAFNMSCIVYDPFISRERAAREGVELVTLEELFHRSDFITVHTPLTKETKHLIGPRSLPTMKDGVRIVNCARGGIVDEDALDRAIADGKVAGAALDVFENEPPTASPLLSRDEVIVTPHLGASTVEAQTNVAVSVARQCREVLRGGSARYVVNAPMIPQEQQEILEPCAMLLDRMGRLLIQLVEGRVEGIEIIYGGEFATSDFNTRFLSRVALKGLLDPILQIPVNIVNAEFVAQERGITVSETVTAESQGFKNIVTLRVKTDTMTESLSGSVSGPGNPRIVAIGEYRTDMSPTGDMVISRHIDKPGVIGRVATILGQVDVNIAGMQVGRHHPGEEAIMVLGVDSPVPPKAMDEIRKVDGIRTATYVHI